jgi:hypothetical protein
MNVDEYTESTPRYPCPDVSNPPRKLSKNEFPTLARTALLMASVKSVTQTAEKEPRGNDLMLKSGTTSDDEAKLVPSKSKSMDGDTSDR